MRRRRVRGGRGGGDGGRVGGMANQVNLTGSFCIPQIDCEHVEGSVDFVDVDLFIRSGILHHEPDTRRRGYWSSILQETQSAHVPSQFTTNSPPNQKTNLIAKATHASSDGLLDDMQRPDAAVVDGRHGLEMFGRAQRTTGCTCWVHRRWGRNAIHRKRWRLVRQRLGPLVLDGGIHDSDERGIAGVAGSDERGVGQELQDHVYI